MSVNEIIVGVDGSATSYQALNWAASEADRRRADLVVLHVYDWRVFGAASPIAARYVADARGIAETIVENAVAEARRLAPSVTVRGEALLGSAGPTLIAASGNGAMTVVGNRGRNGFASLLLGSVGQQVATHAAGPVVVVRGRPDPDGPVVVGVDGSADSEVALAMAFDEATVRGSGVLAVHAYARADLVLGDVPIPIEDAGDRLDEELAVLREQIAPWREKYPDVAVESVAIAGRPAAVLAGISGRASVVVVGTRGRGGFAGLLLGSVGLQLLHHADCPVFVARAEGPVS
jgi:nucleotide-binding universal stress UspA family protein